MTHRLILVEGLPASGKSTAAKFIADALHFTNVDEGAGDHPADFEHHALLDDRAFVKTQSMFSDRDDLRDFCAAADVFEAGTVVPIEDWMPQPVQEWLAQHKIYDVLPWAQQRGIMLEKWRVFAENEGARGHYVFNCVFLQNPMCESMLRFDLPLSESAAMIGEIAEIIAPLKPFVVYLQTDDISARIESVRAERGEEWLHAVIDYHCGGAYGRANGLTGYEGYLAALRERQTRELAILEGLDLPYAVIPDASADWSAAYAKILEALQF